MSCSNNLNTYFEYLFVRHSFPFAIGQMFHQLEPQLNKCENQTSECAWQDLQKDFSTVSHHYCRFSLLTAETLVHNNMNKTTQSQYIVVSNTWMMNSYYYYLRDTHLLTGIQEVLHIPTAFSHAKLWLEARISVMLEKSRTNNNIS